VDIVGALERSVRLILAVVEPLFSNDVIAGLFLVLVLVVILGKGK